MQPNKDKAQRPATQDGTCPRCLGKKSVKTDRGQVICPTCRGTGKSSGYLTK
jgi:DnaJ-class molecular chaperone